MGYDIVFRRCSEEESDYIKENCSLPPGLFPISRHGGRHKSEPHKWVSVSWSCTKRYNPKGMGQESYTHGIVMYTYGGTVSALRAERNEGIVRRGPRGGYGIPAELLDWFNNRILEVETFDLRHEDLPAPAIDHPFRVLKNEQGEYATFMAFKPEYLDIPGFSESISRIRMSWLKTSLLWMLWRSDWGRASDQQRIIRVDVTGDYLRNLMQEGVSSKKRTSRLDEILYQYDPDRRIVGRRMRAGKDYWVKAGRTVHFGLRGPVLEEFIDKVADGRIEDITDKCRSVLQDMPEHPTHELCCRLHLEPEVLTS
ncbi:MAG: DUF4291 domain-containing protein [Nanoarchaeota archaeon]|nr:DUF4291 domain-containing protein [Nanoarchaeota archaeon]